MNPLTRKSEIHMKKISLFALILLLLTGCNSSKMEEALSNSGQLDPNMPSDKKVASAENEKIINSEFKLVANFAVDNKITNYTPINIQTDGNCVEEVIQSTNWEYFDINAKNCLSFSEKCSGGYAKVGASNKENISNKVSIHLAVKPNCEIRFRAGIGDPKNKWNVTTEEGKLLTVYLSGKTSNIWEINYREVFSDL